MNDILGPVFFHPVVLGLFVLLESTALILGGWSLWDVLVCWWRTPRG